MKDSFEAFKKQNELMKTALGIGSNPLSSLAELAQVKVTNYNLGAIGSISEMIKSIAGPKLPDYTSIALGSNFPSQLDAIKQFQSQNQFALNGLTSSLAQIASMNQGLSDSLARLTASQFTVSNSIAEMVKAMQVPHFEKFNSLDVVLGNLTKSYLNEIKRFKDWSELEIIEEANEVIASNAIDLATDTEISSQELNTFFEAILVQLGELLSKATSQKAKRFLSHLITTIGFLISVYGFYLQQKDITNQEAVNETKKLIKESEKRILRMTKEAIESSKEEVSELIKSEFSKLNKVRIATTNVNLRKRPKKKSQIIGTVTSGQEVTVIEIHHKYLLVMYLDKETGDPKSGFVVKKYFTLKDAEKH